MNQTTRRQINYCISEVESIVRELRRISEEVPDYAKGINTNQFQQDLNQSARRYEKAAGQLRKLK